MKSAQCISLEHRIHALAASETERETAVEILDDISRLPDPKEAVQTLALLSVTLIQRLYP